MKFVQNVIDEQGRKVELSLSGQPDECPICHVSLKPLVLGAFIDLNTLYSEEFNNSHAEVIFRCPSKACRSVFIGGYLYLKHSGYIYNYVYPISEKPTEFSTEIRGVSGKFIEIYNQAEAAESHELPLVAGPGYRKSLEFLIKDYAIKESTESKVEEIQHMQLSKVIDNFIDDKRIKEIAKRAAWLGNDETHYLRLWEDKDVTDLKKLINLTVNWIENVENYKKVIIDMPDGK